MNWLDFLFLLLILASVIGGIKDGLARGVVSLVALVLGLFCGLWFYGSVASVLMPYVSHPGVANVIGFFVLFIAFLLLGTLVGVALEKLLKWAGLTWLDRLLGGGFGVIRGLLLCVVVVMAMSAFAPKPPPESVVHSRIAPHAMRVADVLVHAAPREVKDGFRESYERARRIWAETMKRPLPELPSKEI